MPMPWKKGASASAWAVEPHNVTIVRGATGTLGITVKGGSEYDGLPRITLVRGKTPNFKSGELRGHEEIIAIDGKPVAGKLHASVIAALRNAGEEVTLSVLPAPANPAGRKLSDLTPEVAASNSHAAAILAQIEASNRPYRIHTVVLERNASGSYGVKVTGCLAEGGLPCLNATDPNISSGSSIAEGDCLLAVDGVNVIAMQPGDIQAMVDKAAVSVELTILHPKDGKAPTWKEVVEADDSDADVKALKRDIHTGVLAASVPYTTRAPRAGEVDGKHYNFVTKEKFEELKARNLFVETGERDGVFYGTLKPDADVPTAHAPTGPPKVRSRLYMEAVRPKTVTLKRFKLDQDFGFVLEGFDDLATYIKQVVPGSLADESGLERGMRVLKFAGKNIERAKEEVVLGLVEQVKTATSVEVEVQRERPSVPAVHQEEIHEEDETKEEDKSEPVPVPEPQPKKSSYNAVIAAAAVAAVSAVAAVGYTMMDV
eukprot:m.170537 g.170537  ORF g.170537 m.170537 type:complete len:486 (-) comp17830_c4_seq1:168-1625(-)